MNDATLNQQIMSQAKVEELTTTVNRLIAEQAALRESIRQALRAARTFSEEHAGGGVGQQIVDVIERKINGKIESQGS